MSAAVSSPCPADDALLSASTSSLPAAVPESVPALPADLMPPSGQRAPHAEAPGDMEAPSPSSHDQPGSAAATEAATAPSLDPPQAQNHDRDDTEMEGTAEPEDRPQPPVANGDPATVDQNEGNDDDTATDDEARNVDDDDASDSEDDDYDYEHREFLERYKEDLSVPGPEELEEMNRHRESEVYANEDQPWKTQAFTALDDPEHVPMDEVGVVSWTLEGFHGTKAAPNKQRWRLSPPTIMTNHDGNQYAFTLKVFPRGNDGTEQMSVYLQCQPVIADSQNDQIVTKNGTRDDVENSWWEVTAQFGCVVYNPVEPRVHKFQKSHHQFTLNNSDYGWTRFAGPWNQLHLRQHLQYRPLLQNDNVHFRAYIRLVKDQTRALWYHNQYSHIADWDPVLKTGYRGVVLPDNPSGHTALISVLTIWFELLPFRHLVQAHEISDGLIDPMSRFQPLLDDLKICLHKKQLSRKHAPTERNVSLDRIVLVLGWYGIKELQNVAEVCETLQKLIMDEIKLGLERKPSAEATRIAELARAFFESYTFAGAQPRPVLPICKELNDEGSAAEPTFEAPKLTSTQQIATNVTEFMPSPVQPVCYLELPRQAYDPSKRKWKKLLNKIKLDDEISIRGTSFTLFSFICHAGELGSGRFHPVVRPRGPGTAWLRWSTRGGSRGSVLAQTHRQAVLAHEGSDSGDASSSVACGALYVCTDAMANLLVLGAERDQHDVYNPLAEYVDKRIAPNEGDSITVAAHLSDRYRSHKSMTGSADVWESRHTTLLTMHKDDTIYELHEKLKEQLPNAQFCVWPLDMARDMRQFSQPIVNSHIETPLMSFKDGTNGMHFWVHVLPAGEQAEASKRQYDEIARTKAAESLASLRQSVPALPTNSSPVVEQTPLVPTPDHTDQDTVMSGTNDDTEASQEPPVPSNPTSMLSLMTRPSHEQAIGGSVADEQLNVPPPVYSPALGTEALSVPMETAIPPPPPSVTFQEPLKHVYVLVKHFYPVRKTDGVLQPRVEPCTTLLVPENDGIAATVTRPEKDPYQKNQLRYYLERTGDIPSVISGEMTFAAAGIMHGSIIITEPVLSDANTAALTGQGHPVRLTDMFAENKLPGRNNFGTGWSSCPVKFSRAHGKGSVVYANGDAYTGAFCSGKRHGQGTMLYSDGSNYQGEWKDDMPNGQGTMVYSLSGNKYVGPFQNGKQTGSGGVTYWKDASVHENICRICYVDERNTVFIRCGHMVACQECAQQVSECPICRRQIDTVIRVWDALQ